MKNHGVTGRSGLGGRGLAAILELHSGKNDIDWLGEGMIDDSSRPLLRRDLLIYSGMALGVELLQPVAGIAAGLESALRPSELFCATLGYNPPSVTRQMAIPEGESTVAVWSGADKAKATTFSLPFAPHSYIPSRRTPTEIIAISKWGRQIATFDLITGVVGRVVRAGDGRRQLFGLSEKVRQVDRFIPQRI
ncbi:MAG: hypothetical protein JNJ49_00950 [Bdellovibrionaceae bacterium]|nr:hypothetical protein [Pseudobdellovibrionaceae bacterium]